MDNYTIGKVVDNFTNVWEVENYTNVWVVDNYTNGWAKHFDIKGGKHCHSPKATTALATPSKERTWSCSALLSNALHSSELLCTDLHLSAMPCTALNFSALICPDLQCQCQRSVLLYITLLCTALYCSKQHLCVHFFKIYFSALLWLTTFYSTLLCTAYCPTCHIMISPVVTK